MRMLALIYLVGALRLLVSFFSASCNTDRSDTSFEARWSHAHFSAYTHLNILTTVTVIMSLRLRYKKAGHPHPCCHAPSPAATLLMPRHYHTIQRSNCYCLSKTVIATVAPQPLAGLRSVQSKNYSHCGAITSKGL